MGTGPLRVYRTPAGCRGMRAARRSACVGAGSGVITLFSLSHMAGMRGARLRRPLFPAPPHRTSDVASSRPSQMASDDFARRARSMADLLLGAVPLDGSDEPRR